MEYQLEHTMDKKKKSLSILWTVNQALASTKYNGNNNKNKLKRLDTNYLSNTNESNSSTGFLN